MALAAAFIISAIATPAGISGAVLLLPFQVACRARPARVTPTDLLNQSVRPGPPHPRPRLDRPGHRDRVRRAGIGGIAGGYLGARMQSQLPDILIRRIVGVLAVAIAAQFLRNGLS